MQTLRPPPTPRNISAAGADHPLQRATARVSSLWVLSLAVFLVAVILWWANFQYFGNPNQNYGLGFWVPNDRPAWLPHASTYHPILGHHFFGDWFQLYFLIHSGLPYTGHIFHTSLNPGYLLPAYVTSWLPYPAAGYVYLGLLVIAWLAPAGLIFRYNRPLAVLYIAAATATVPALMALDLGQPQIFVFLFGLLSYYYLLQGRPIASSVALGIAVAIKPYMLIFVLIFVARRLRASAVRAIVVGAMINLLMGAILVGSTALSLGFWTHIIRSSFSYGSGSTLSIWGHGGFLRADSSVYGLLSTLANARVAGVSSISSLIGSHYAVLSMLMLAVGLFWYWARGRRLGVAAQWLYFTLLIMLIPSYSLGYAWMLLLIPFVGIVLPNVAVSVPWVPRRQAMDSSAGMWICLLISLAILPFPSNIELPGFTAQFGPNGNTIMTPLLLLVTLALLVKSGVKPRRGNHVHVRPHKRVTIVGFDSELVMMHFEPEILGWPLAVSVCVEIAAVALCYGLSR